MRRMLLLAAVVSVSVAGCMGPPRPVEDPRPFIEVERPRQIWLTTEEDSLPSIVLRPRVFGDTILGHRASGDVVWVGLDDVRWVEARRPDVTRTILFAAGIGTVAVAILSILHDTGESDPRVGIDVPEGYVGLHVRLAR